MSLVQVEASTVADLDTNLRGLLSQRPDALIMTVDAILNSQISKIIDFLESNRIPGIFAAREYVLAGGLISYGPSVPDLFRLGATYGTAAKIPYSISSSASDINDAGIVSDFR